MKYVLINSQVHFEKTIWYNVRILIKLFINSDIYPIVVPHMGYSVMSV